MPVIVFLNIIPHREQIFIMKCKNDWHIFNLHVQSIGLDANLFHLN